LLNDVVCFALFAFIKWHWLRVKGVSPEDRTAIFSNRKGSFHLERLLRTYPERTLLIVDGLSRKSKHITVNVFRMLFLTVILQDPVVSTQLVIVRGIIELAFLFSFRNSNDLFGFGGLFFGAMSRIRDGVQGRLNYITASAMGLMGLVWFTAILFCYKKLGLRDDIIMHLAQFVYLPLTIGDALGEIVGSMWGVQKIRVLGIGEINKKSKLGTAAVFFGSLIPMIGILSIAHLGAPWLILAVFISVLSTGVELFSPRSTDNFFIPAVNSVVTVFFSALFLV
jgi:dolichol kinase